MRLNGARNNLARHPTGSLGDAGDFHQLVRFIDGEELPLGLEACRAQVDHDVFMLFDAFHFFSPSSCRQGMTTR